MRCAQTLPFVVVYVPFLEDQGIPLVHFLSLRFHEYCAEPMVAAVGIEPTALGV